MKYNIVSFAVLALLSQSSRVQAGKKSMIALATEDDQIASGSSEWNDIGYIQQSSSSSRDQGDEDVSDDQNVGIGSLNKQKIKMKVSEEKAEKASEIRDEINERESSDQNK